MLISPNQHRFAISKYDDQARRIVRCNDDFSIKLLELDLSGSTNSMRGVGQARLEISNPAGVDDLTVMASSHIVPARWLCQKLVY